MLKIILGILVFIIILGVIVLVHEGGHFFFAKKAGILCYEFSIGMGPLIWQKQFGETRFSIRAIPLGGYVSMAGEEVNFNPIAGYDYAKLTVNEQGMVTEIFVHKDLKTKFPESLDKNDFKKIIASDLTGSETNPLFITIEDSGEAKRYMVERTCQVRFSLKEAFQIAPYDRLFLSKPLHNRFMSVLAGPMMNFVLAFVIFFIMGLCTGYTNYKTTVIGSVEQATPAYVAGLRDGDKIISIGFDNKEFTAWSDISEILAKYANGEDFSGTVTVKYLRDNIEQVAVVNPYVYVQSAYLFFENDGSNSLKLGAFPNKNEETPSYKVGLRPGDELVSVENENGDITTFNNRSEVLAYFNTGKGSESTKFIFTVKRVVDGTLQELKLDQLTTYKKKIFNDNNIDVCKVQVGISPSITRNIGRLLVEPFKQIGSSCLVIFKTLGALFTRGSGLSIKDLSGPVGIASATVSIVDQGMISILNWAAILSVNIGLMNIIPLPALDGGRLAFLGYEAITKKKTNPKVENIIHSIGFILLLILFAFVFLNDTLKLFK